MKSKNFDVLIVYPELSASSASAIVDVPFGTLTDDISYNQVYAYFLLQCQKQGLTAAFTTSADIIGPGKCSSYWLFENGTWEKNEIEASSKFIFDKFSPTTPKLLKQHKLLFSSDAITSINSTKINQIFLDKQLTYEKFEPIAIPTVTIDQPTMQGLRDALARLQNIIKSHPDRKDFGQRIILKDRCGSEGTDVYKFDLAQTEEILAVLTNSKKKSFIIQPFMLFDSGYVYENTPVSADIRLIFLNKKIVLSYVRMADKGSFLCNAHQGGSLQYIKVSDIPKPVLKKAKGAFSLLGNSSSFFSLDFVISNNGNAFLLEGNSRTGINWDVNDRSDTVMTKKLIRDVVAVFKSRIAKMQLGSEVSTTPILEIGKIPPVPEKSTSDFLLS